MCCRPSYRKAWSKLATLLVGKGRKKDGDDCAGGRIILLSGVDGARGKTPRGGAAKSHVFPLAGGNAAASCSCQIPRILKADQTGREQSKPHAFLSSDIFCPGTF